MPIIFEKDIDRSDLAIGIAKALFNQYDFNAGQQSIIDSAYYMANVTQHISYDIQGDMWQNDSQITRYYLNIDLSHPEAVDESLSNVLEETKNYIYELLEFSDSVPKGDLTELGLEHNYEWAGIMNKIGLFV